MYFFRKGSSSSSRFVACLSEDVFSQGQIMSKGQHAKWLSKVLFLPPCFMAFRTADAILSTIYCLQQFREGNIALAALSGELGGKFLKIGSRQSD